MSDAKTQPSPQGPSAERVAHLPAADSLSPADRYEELFEAVQRGRVFSDSKTFVDCVPRLAPEEVLHAYRQQRDRQDFDLSAFVHAHFDAEIAPTSHYVSDPDQSLKDHIDGLWDVLTRQPQEHPCNSSLLPLPNAYVVPGGRFRELYYWDSFFTMLGLAESGRQDLLRAMADNFAWLIDVYGHVPNGNRSYYLSRSQPPVFALMVRLFEDRGVCEAVKYLPQLHREYLWWMGGAGALRPGEAHRHCVRLHDGTLLNRYWDDRDTPRDEAFLEDETTASESSRPAKEVYRDLRAAAASGWDFSARWCDIPGELSTIHTTDLLPVDLNCFLYVLESQIALLSKAAGEHADAEQFHSHAERRRQAIQQWMWNPDIGAFFDYNWRHRRFSKRLTAATVTPLFVELATAEQAARTADVVRERLLAPGGMATSEETSAQQWDCPNGWAPLQWIAIRGFELAGETGLSREIAKRWLDTVGSLYQREGKLVEKYVLTHREGAVGGHGGEYPLQDGFGWSNGVTRRLLHEDPSHPARHLCSAKRG